MNDPNSYESLFSNNQNSVWPQKYIDGMFGTICPKCGTPNYISGYAKMNLCPKEVSRLDIIFKLGIHCYSCDHNYEVTDYDLLDADITPVIEAFNNKGYTTEASCIGHSGKDPFDGSDMINDCYVMLNPRYEPVFNQFPPEDPIEIEEQMFAKYGDLILHIKDSSKYSNEEKRKIFLSYINNLPDLSVDN